MIGVTMMDPQAFITTHRNHEHKLTQATEHRRQAEQNGSVVRRHHGTKRPLSLRAKTI